METYVKVIHPVVCGEEASKIHASDMNLIAVRKIKTIIEIKYLYSENI